MALTTYPKVSFVTPTAKTATTDGTGTGAIAAGESWITVANGGDVNNIITLPPAVAGTQVTLFGTAAYELRTTAPATIAINGGSGANAESAIPANTIVHMSCQSATTWKGFQQAVGGTLALVEVAA